MTKKRPFSIAAIGCTAVSVIVLSVMAVVEQAEGGSSSLATSLAMIPGIIGIVLFAVGAVRKEV